MSAQVIAQVVSVIAGATSAREQAMSRKKEARAVKRARGQQNEKRAKVEEERKKKEEKETLRLVRDKDKQAKIARGAAEQGRKGTILTGPQGLPKTESPSGQQNNGPETKTLLGL